MATALWQARVPVVTPAYAQGIGGGLPSAEELYAMAAAKQAINNAFLPSGSDAHKTWVSQLATALTAAGVQDVTTPPFTFTQWSPTNWSLTIQNGSKQDDIDVAGYVPYSGTTPPGGITAQLAYLAGVTGFFGPPPAGEQATTLSANFMGFPLNVSVNGQTLAQGITNLGVGGKIVVLDLPTPALPLQDVLSGAFFVDDAKTIPDELGVAGLTGLFFTSAFASALLSAGALGIVAVMPFRRFWANNYYFRGTVAGIPTLLVDVEEGARLKDVIADSATSDSFATLTLAAELNASATLPSLLGVIPGQSEKLIILNSHSDSANIIEEIGPIVIWGLARYLASLPLSARPYTVQIMIEGSHLVGDLDEHAYITANSADLMQNALVDITIEHLGGRELMQSPVGGQVPRLDGLLETNWLSVGPIPGTTMFSDPVVRATIELAKKLGRSFVAPTSLVGLGISGPWRAVTTTTASIDQPAWLLNINMPHNIELNRLMDFQALQTAVEGYAEMLTTFMNTPAADFTKAYVA